MLAAANLSQNAVLLHLPIESTQQSLEALARTKFYISHIKPGHSTAVTSVCQFTNVRLYLTNTGKTAKNLASKAVDGSGDGRGHGDPGKEPEIIFGD